MFVFGFKEKFVLEQSHKSEKFIERLNGSEIKNFVETKP